MDKTFLGIDYGSTNIGVALGINGFVQPLKVLSGKNIQSTLNEINRMAIENSVNKIIIGLPLTAEGKETKQSLEVRRFAKMLRVFVKKPSEFYSEHMSTHRAIEETIHTGISMKKRTVTDHLSAALILKEYLDEHN